jgi:hypothetical protein
MFQTKSRRENQNTYVHSIIFPESRAVCDIMWKKHRKYSCVSTSTLVARTHHNVPLTYTAPLEHLSRWHTTNRNGNAQDLKCNPSCQKHSGYLHTVRDRTFWGWHYDSGLLGCDTVLCDNRLQPLWEASCLCLQDTALWLISGTYLTQSIKCQLEKAVEAMAMDSRHWQQSDSVTQQTANRARSNYSCSWHSRRLFPVRSVAWIIQTALRLGESLFEAVHSLRGEALTPSISANRVAWADAYETIEVAAALTHSQSEHKRA